jgi:hypothetical protein
VDTLFSVFTYHGRPRNLGITDKPKSQQTLVVLVEFLAEFLCLTFDLPTTTTRKIQAFTSKARSTANLPGALCICFRTKRKISQFCSFPTVILQPTECMGGGFYHTHHRGWGFIGPSPAAYQKGLPHNNRGGPQKPPPSIVYPQPRYIASGDISLHYALRVKGFFFFFWFFKFQ